MIARPKMSQNEWKSTEIRASKVGNVSPFSCPGDLDLDGRDAVVADAVAADPAFETLLTSALRAVSTAKTEVLTLAFGDLLGKIRSVACVELAARELRKRHPGVAFDRIHLDLRSM